MTIKKKLALNFTGIVATVLLVAMVSIYLLFAYYSRLDFYQHLKDRAHVAGELYLEADEINRDSLSKVRAKFLEALPGEIIRIYNRHDTAEFIKDRKMAWPGSIIDQVRDDKYLAYTQGTRQVVGIYYPDNQGNFVILVSAIDSGTQSRLNTLLLIMVPLYVLVLGGMYLGGLWFARRALSPIAAIIKQVGLIRASNLHLRVTGGQNNDEIAALANQFNQLLEHLEHAFMIEKNFSAHVTHELRTPLTAIMGEIEVLLERERTSGEYRETLRSVLAETEHLASTINNILELSRVVASNMLAMHLLPVRMDTLLQDIQEQWDTQPGGYCLTVTTPPPGTAWILTVLGNQQLLSIALNNIIQNAFKFSGNQPVDVALATVDGGVRIAVSDTGVGVGPADVEHIFEPFYRGEQVYRFPGTGLGLYIANQIVRLYHGKITIRSRPGATTLTIYFPVQTGS